jgi:hypothetical protein
MSKLGILAAVTAIVTAIGFASLSQTAEADAADGCVHKDFKTVLIRDACKQGGQKAAKDAMKKFMKDAKIKSCNQCHSKLAPKYELKADAVDQFKKAGGALLEGAAAPAGKGSAAKPAK